MDVSGFSRKIHAREVKIAVLGMGQVSFPAASDQAGPINLGNPDDLSMWKLAQEVISRTAARVRDDPKRWRSVIFKAVGTIDWRLKVSCQEGIERVISYFRLKGEALCAR